MKHFLSIAVALLCLGVVSWSQFAAAANVNVSVYPGDVGAPGSAFHGDGSWNPAVGPPTADLTTGAPGWGTSSFISNITGTGGPQNVFNYTEFQVNPNTLFGQQLTMGDIASISYYTKNNSNTSLDWDIRIYTDKTAPTGSFYNTRFETLNPPLIDNAWHQWSTDTNLQVTNAHSGVDGSNTPLSGPLSGLSATYKAEQVNYISFIAGFSGNNSPIADNIDGIQITLTNGDVANINLVAPEPASFVMIGLGAVGLLVVVRRRRAV